MATSSSSLQWHPLLNSNPLRQNPNPSFHLHRVIPAAASVVAFRREDFDTFKRRVVSGDVWRHAWRTANDGFEQLVYDARKAAERLDRRYSISRRVETAVEIASIRAREIDREFSVTQKWRSFSHDFSRNLPRGACPACKREFIGSKNSMVRCSGCGNIVWQPQSDVFSRGKKGTSGSKSEPEIIDVEFEEK